MNKKEIIDLLYKVIAYINGDISPTDRIVANSFYYVEPTKTSGYSRCYINIIKPADIKHKFWCCSMISIYGEGRIYLLKGTQEQTEWLQRLFNSALSIKPISESEFNDKWNKATNILKQIEKL